MSRKKVKPPGDARPGPAPRYGERMVLVAFHAPPELLARIDRVRGPGRSSRIRTALRHGLDALDQA